MIGLSCARKSGWWVGTVAALGIIGAPSLASAQLSKPGPKRGTTTAPAAAAPSDADGKVRLKGGDQIEQVVSTVPVNPSDPIALVNGEAITRQQLADEAVSRKGKEILDTLIARRLIEQELRKRKLDVTANEVDQEIETVSQNMAGIGREAWLRALEKEKGISPVQYARDIIYPTIALRKLASARVQVTNTDIKDAVEANFGAKLHCRMISTDKQRTAVEIWEQLKKNPSGFEKVAKERSIDTATRSLGGLLGEPISRHAYPRSISDAAFQQLVDGDKDDKDTTHVPKDGDITGPIQVNQTLWVLLKRESLDMPMNFDPNDPSIRKQLHAQMFDAKLKQAMTDVFEELMEASEIDNRLTGMNKIAHEAKQPEYGEVGEKDVKLMRTNDSTPMNPKGRATTGGPARSATPAPTGLPAEVANPASGFRGSSPRQ